MHRSIRRCFLFGSLMLAWLAADAARAETCPPLRLMDQVRMASANGGTTMLVPVTINGVDKFMIFDTGASASSVTRAAAQELGLSLQGVRGRPLYDIYGNESRDAATIARFKFGQQEMRDSQFRIWPNPDLEKADPRIVGVLSPAQLTRYDVDVDFANAVLKLFSPEHCEGKILYWKVDAVAIIRFDTRHGQISIAATLDGQKLDAIIDSGAVNSVLSTNAARRFFGLNADSPGMKLSPVLTKFPQYPVYQRQFSELSFNGVTVSKPVIAIWPDIINRNADRSVQNTANRARPNTVGVSPPQLIVGMDILRKLHAYIAFGEGRMYVSEAPENSQPPK